jgi:bifunctional non-homologous end joining protein LigD
VEIAAEYPVKVTNPNKLLWPDAGITKVGYMQYLAEVAPYMLPHLKGRPLTMIRFPDGVNGHSFYQKDAPQGTPEWVKTVARWSSDRNDDLHSVLVDSIATLLWLANIGCLEMHIGFTTIDHPDQPTHIAFDLDPSVPGFEPVREVAMCLHELLDGLGLPHVAKTSGATGLQVFLPLAQGYSFADTRLFTKAVADYLASTLSRIVTLERLKKNRGNKVYVDYPQHGSTRTLIAPYSARATKRATVSTPLRWSELAAGAVPTDFTIHSVPNRLQRVGDLMDIGPGIALEDIVSFLRRQPQGSV